MTNCADLCARCAWRAACQKKFMLSGRDVSCPDYTKDVSVPAGEAEPPPAEDPGRGENTSREE